MAKQKTSGWHFSTSHTSSIQSATSFRICGLITGPEPMDIGDKVDEDASVAQDKRADGRYLDSFLSNVLRTRSSRKITGSLYALNPDVSFPDVGLSEIVVLTVPPVPCGMIIDIISFFFFVNIYRIATLLNAD